MRPVDDILTYLEDPPVPTSLIIGQGGVMKYWYHLESTSPNLSRYGSDFLSAPGNLLYPVCHLSP